MVSECPVCRHPINAFLFLLKLSSWSCRGCGSRLRMNKSRRYLALVPFGGIVVVAATFLSRAGWTDFAVIPVAVVVWLPCFLFFDRAIVLERRGFWCQDCGYDLRGQVDPHCPECGRDFDSTETAQMKLPDPTTAVKRHTRKRGYVRLVLAIVLVLALAASVILGLVLYRRTQLGGVPPVGTQPASTVPVEAIDQS